MQQLPRRFTDEEMAVIIKRAAALQTAREARSVTLEELQEIGAQVGIDPALIAHVAQGGSLKLARSKGPLATPPTNAVEEHRIPVPMSTKDYGLLLEAIRRVAGAQGQANQVFDSFEWRSGSDRDAQWYAVTVTGRPDATYLRVEGEFGVAVALMHIVGLPVAFLGTALLFTSSLPLAGEIGIAAAGLAGIFGGIRALWRRLLRRTESRVSALAQEVERDVKQLAEQASMEGSLPPPA